MIMDKPSCTRRERGVSLLFAMLTLVVLALATLALVRSVDTGALMLGNVSFKQDATVAGDQAVRTAFLWLKDQTSATLGANKTDQGYYASTLETDATKPVDVTGQQQTANAQRQLIDWDGDGCKYATSAGNCSLVAKSAGKTPNGNSDMSYAIFRLCAQTDAAALASGIANNCATPSGATGGGHEAGQSYPKLPTSGAYYRVVVRVRGSRNSVSFIETIIQL